MSTGVELKVVPTASIQLASVSRSIVQGGSETHNLELTTWQSNLLDDQPLTVNLYREQSNSDLPVHATQDVSRISDSKATFDLP